MASKRKRSVVNAVSVKDNKATCPCGEVIDLKPDPDPPILHYGKVAYLPQLVAIGCPKCGAEVRLDRFLKHLPRRAK